jgi:hypothetical protein
MPMTHRRSSGSFGFSLATALCGVKVSEPDKLATNPKHVNCPACRERIVALRAAATRRASAL